MDAERLSWKVFRFADDKRQWKQLAQARRAFFIKAANSANQDGTSVEISAETFSKAAGERRTAFRRLADLEAMGVCLPELHVDERGTVREQLTRFQGTRRRWLRFGPLEDAQRTLDSGDEFMGHLRLTKEQQRTLQLQHLPKDEQEKLAA